MLLRGWYPHAVLLLAGLLMLLLSVSLGYTPPPLTRPTGLFTLDLFRYVTESFGKTLSGVGLMIMGIGGFVAYMDSIGASRALVRVAVQPLNWIRPYPYLSSSLLIPLGQLLFVCIPSAAGMGLLLMASVYPLIVRLGVSRLSAVSVIVACTSFGVGPASAITARAAAIVNVPSVEFFFAGQLPLVWPTSLLMATAYFFVNRHFDRRDEAKEEVPIEDLADSEATEAPAYYALFPVLPLIALVSFSEVLGLSPIAVKLDTTTAMFMSMAVSALVHLLRTRDLEASLHSLQIFFGGMASIFKSVVTLIIAADMFSKGLIALGFIRALLALADGAGLGATGVGVAMTVLIFMASVLMGSGNASFFAFGPLVPRIAAGLGADPLRMILPMQLSASMGRSVSPIAGVVIATAEIARVEPLALARRNALPLAVSLAFLLMLHYSGAWSMAD
ncbi:MAG: C4-dicarboxylate transporter DcuC [Myxococcota bacterium]